MGKFNKQEKIKRIISAKQLKEKGLTIKEISSYFGVSEDTVKEYLESDVRGLLSSGLAVISEEKKTVSLDHYSKGFINNTDYFRLAKTKNSGFVCKICKKYCQNYELVKFRDDALICRECYHMLKPGENI